MYPNGNTKRNEPSDNALADGPNCSTVRIENCIPNKPAAQPPVKLSGKYPGFKHLPSQRGVYRCKLWPEKNKRDPNHADYKGVLQLTGSKASILLWVHSDGTLGLRLEKISERKGE